jgi:hypothetical protein
MPYMFPVPPISLPYPSGSNSIREWRHGNEEMAGMFKEYRPPPLFILFCLMFSDSQRCKLEMGTFRFFLTFIGFLYIGMVKA